MRLHFKQRLFSWFDSYDIYDKEDALHALMVVLAIDADECSQNNG